MNFVPRCSCGPQLVVTSILVYTLSEKTKGGLVSVLTPVRQTDTNGTGGGG